MNESIMYMYARAIVKNCPDPANAENIGSLFATARTDIDQDFFIKAIKQQWSQQWEKQMLEHYGVSNG
ncbi:hypothetical protein [uncultured Mediterranean phage uvMED]|jgi:hypothetical protein|nr:hypothetical protein [uncultured Mediterranean phage uvMED]